MSAAASRIASAFAVPPMLLGPEPVLDTPRKLGEYLRGQCQLMGLDFDQWPQEAQDVEIADYEARMRAMYSRPLFVGTPPTLWGRICDWWGGL